MEIKLSEVFFTSDTHFYHKNIIEYCFRPYQNTDEMNEALIANWNDNVRPDDIVYHLGDFSFNKSKNKNFDLFSRLNGRKYLIVGNHDESSTLELPWFEKHNYLEVKIDKKMFILFHYPIVSWNKMNRDNTYHLYGHTHELLDKNMTWTDHTNKYHNRAYHVGVDSNNYAPIHIDDVVKIIDNRIQSDLYETKKDEQEI